MYNRYIPNGASYTRIPMEEPSGQRGASSQGDEGTRRSRSPGGGTGGPSTPAGEGPLEKLFGMWRGLKLERLDGGDLLLLLIVLLLLTEGDDLELVIALGLALVLGLDGET